ncbi:MAG TPA: IS256 family transposase [Clostridiales bacterium]|jgi:putative transposase|nr:IS256 family transposase [Clostridiales bacterium]
MSQIDITLDRETLIASFAEDYNKALTYLLTVLLNAIMRAESEEQLGAAKHERSPERKDYRNGTRDRPLTTRIGRIILQVPRHRNVPFETMIFDQYQRSEAALLTTMAEMVVQGVSTRKVSNVMEELCDTSFSRSSVSVACKRLDDGVQAFKERPLLDHYPFVTVDAKYFKVREDHRIVSKALMVAMGITADGRKEIIGFEAYDSETKNTWTAFFEKLQSRGLKDVHLFTSDSHAGLIAAMKKVYPKVAWQRCQFHFVKNIMDHTPKKEQKGLQSELREMFDAPTIEEARKRKDEIVKDYGSVAEKAMMTLDEGFEASMSVMYLPGTIRKILRTSNAMERENGELGRRYDVIRIFPNMESLVRLMGSVLIDRHHILSSRQGVFSETRYKEAVNEFRPLLIQVAYEQEKLLEAA